MGSRSAPIVIPPLREFQQKLYGLKLTYEWGHSSTPIHTFDTARKAIVLAAASKGGKSSSLVYKQMIAKADARFTMHQAAVSGTPIKQGSHSTKDRRLKR
jgi:hypothetical protein